MYIVCLMLMLLGRTILESGTLDFQSYSSASKRSPLAASLFSIDGVTGVFLSTDYVSVSIGEGHAWNVVKPMVREGHVTHVLVGSGQHQ